MADVEVSKVQSAPSLAAIQDTDARWRAFVRRFFPVYLRVVHALGVTRRTDAWNLARALVAHAAHETAAGSGLHRWNFGNLHWGYPGDGPWFGGVDTADGTAATTYATRFRAFSSATEGAAAHAEFIQRRCAYAWRVGIEDPEGFLLALSPHGCGYFTFPAPPEVWRATMRRELAIVDAVVGPPPSNVRDLVALGVVAGVLGGIAWYLDG